MSLTVVANNNTSGGNTRSSNTRRATTTRILVQSNNDATIVRKKQPWALLAMEGLLLLLGMLVVAGSHAVVGLDLLFAPHEYDSSHTKNTPFLLWRTAPFEETTTTTTTSSPPKQQQQQQPYSSNNSAEVSVLVGAELVTHSPCLDFCFQRVLKPALVDAVLAVVLPSVVGVLPLWGMVRIMPASKWLSSKNTGLIMRWLSGGAARTFKRFLHNSSSRSKVGSFATALARRTGKTRRLWESSKKAVQHLYKKRARYSVASELTNLVPPEPKNNGSQTTLEE